MPLLGTSFADASSATELNWPKKVGTERCPGPGPIIFAPLQARGACPDHRLCWWGRVPGPSQNPAEKPILKYTLAMEDWCRWCSCCPRVPCTGAKALEFLMQKGRRPCVWRLGSHCCSAPERQRGQAFKMKINGVIHENVVHKKRRSLWTAKLNGWSPITQRSMFTSFPTARKPKRVLELKSLTGSGACCGKLCGTFHANQAAHFFIAKSDPFNGSIGVEDKIYGKPLVLCCNISFACRWKGKTAERGYHGVGKSACSHCAQPLCPLIFIRLAHSTSTATSKPDCIACVLLCYYIIPIPLRVAYLSVCGLSTSSATIQWLTHTAPGSFFL